MNYMKNSGAEKALSNGSGTAMEVHVDLRIWKAAVDELVEVAAERRRSSEAPVVTAGVDESQWRLGFGRK